MHICKVATISGTFCLSMGQLSPEVVDVGKVGYENSWKEVRIPIELKNLSEVPLATKFDITSPGGALYLLSVLNSSPANQSPIPSPLPSPSMRPTMARRGSLPEIDKDDIPRIPQPPPVPLQPKDSVVPISESKFFTMVLDVSKLDRTAGAFSCKVSFINVNNPQNKMYVWCGVLVVLTNFFLFALKGGECDWHHYSLCAQIWQVLLTSQFKASRLIHLQIN